MQMVKFIFVCFDPSGGTVPAAWLCRGTIDIETREYIEYSLTLTLVEQHLRPGCEEEQ